MKRRLCILLLAALLVLLVPHAASANSPGYNPWVIRIDCTGVAEGVRIDAVLLRADGSERRAEDVYQSGYGDDARGSIHFFYEEGETAFYLVQTAPDGTETRSAQAALLAYGQFTYDGATNRLEPNGTYYSRRQQSMDNTKTILLLILLFFVLPLGLTLLAEFLIALLFRIRPVKYVFAINAITNPVMNILLLLAMLGLLAESGFGMERWVYWVVLGALEVVAVWVEYRFYTRKYPEIERKRLLLFSITANAASFLLGVAAGALNL